MVQSRASSIIAGTGVERRARERPYCPDGVGADAERTNQASYVQGREGEVCAMEDEVHHVPGYDGMRSCIDGDL